MNWFRVHVGIGTHPKTHALAELLQIPWTQALGMVVSILAWAATRDREDVVLDDAAVSLLAQVAGYMGEGAGPNPNSWPRTFAERLVESGWLDVVKDPRKPDGPPRFRFHNWAEWNGSAIRESLSAKERMKKHRQLTGLKVTPNVRSTVAEGYAERSPPTLHNTNNNYPLNPPSRGKLKRVKKTNGHYTPAVPIVDQPKGKSITGVPCGYCDADNGRTDWPGLENPPCEPICRDCRKAWAGEHIGELTEKERWFWDFRPERVNA